MWTLIPNHLKKSSLPSFALRSPNRIFIWYLGKWPKSPFICRCLSKLTICCVSTIIHLWGLQFNTGLLTHMIDFNYRLQMKYNVWNSSINSSWKNMPLQLLLVYLFHLPNNRKKKFFYFRVSTYIFQISWICNFAYFAFCIIYWR
jgi:hypothetical protein